MTRTFVLLWITFLITGQRALLGHPGLLHEIERLSQELASDASNVNGLVQRSYYYRLDGHPEMALSDLATAQRLAPDRRDILVQKGLSLAVMGRIDEAIGELNTFLNGGPGTAEAFAERARLRAVTGERALAVSDYLSAIALEPDVELYVECGRLQSGLGWNDEAAALYREGLRVVGEAQIITESLVQAEIDRGHFEEAVVLVNQQMSRVTIATSWLLRRAEIWEKAGNPEAAKSDLNRALAEVDQALIARPNAIQLVMRAEVLLAMGRPMDAKHDLQAALEKSPRFVKANELLAKVEGGVDSQRIEIP